MSRVRIGGVSLVLWLGVAACATRLPPPAPPDALLQRPSTEAILHTFDRRWQAVQDLRALARVSVTSAKGRYSTRETFLWRRPATLRLETLGVFGQPAMALVADAEHAAIYYPQQGLVLQGAATAANLSRFIGLPLEVEDVVRVLAGQIEPGDKHPWARVHDQMDRDEHLLRFVGEGGTLVQDAWVDSEQLLPRRVIRYTNGGEPAVDVRYTDFRPLTEGFPFPFSLVIWLPRVETELHIQFTAVDLNPGLAPSLFRLTPPEGTRVVPLE